MKRFKVSSNNSNKLTAQDFEVLMTKIAAVTPPPHPPVLKIKVKDLQKGLLDAKKIHEGGMQSDEKALMGMAGLGGAVFATEKIIQGIASTTSIGSIIRDPLLWVTIITGAVAKAKPYTRMMWERKFGKNTLLKEFDTKKFKLKKYDSITDLKSISPNPKDAEMTLKEIAESMKDFPSETPNAWKDGDAFYVFEDSNDIIKIKDMIAMNLTSDKRDLMLTILTPFVAAGVVSAIGAASVALDVAEKARRANSPEGKQTRQQMNTNDPQTQSEINTSRDSFFNRNITRGRK
jgi:hypothetical protein